MPKKSLNSVVIKSSEPDKIRRAVGEYCRQLRRTLPEVERIFWFGSWVSGRATPGSDVDICVVVSSSPDHPRNRSPRLLPDRFPTGIDLLVYTDEEFERMRTESPRFWKAITSGIEM